MAQKGGDIVITSPPKRSLYLVLINQENNVDVPHALRFDIEHSMATLIVLRNNLHSPIITEVRREGGGVRGSTISNS